MKAYFLLHADSICSSPDLEFLSWDEKEAEAKFRTRQIELLNEEGDWGENPDPDEIIEGVYPYAPDIKGSIWDAYCDRDEVEIIWLVDILLPPQESE